MTAKKKILIALGMVLSVAAIVATTIAGTVAYLTSSAAVSNVFTIGDVGIRMYETKVNQNGEPQETGTKTADTNSYHLIPGKSYQKDPTIYVNAGSESSYLFIIARNDISAIEDSVELTMKEQLFKKGWMKYGVAATGNIYVYTGIEKSDAEWDDKVNAILTANDPSTAATAEEAKTIAAARATALENLYVDNNVKAIGVGGAVEEHVDLFEKFTIDHNADIKPYGAAKVNITAVAIQTADFGAIGEKESLDKAWAAVLQTYPYIHTGNQQQ